MLADDLPSRILNYLTEIARGELTLTAEQAIEEPEEHAQRILSGLVYLHEELVFREEEHRARLAAEAADRAKSKFLTTMSHELRTPLNAIIGYNELVRDDLEDVGFASDSTLLADLRRVEVAARHLLTLVDDILDLARVESGQASPQFASVYLPQLLQDARRTIEPLAAVKNLTVVVDAEQLEVTSDPRMLLQCLINLGANAVKFTDRGRITLQARLVEAAFELCVTDTGRGMNQDQLRRVFKAFEQVNPGEHGGTGLGLTITKRFVECLDGVVEVESALASGTRFQLRFPLR